MTPTPAPLPRMFIYYHPVCSCPDCGSDGIVKVALQIVPQPIEVSARCQDCGGVWIEHYNDFSAYLNSCEDTD